MSFEYEPLTMFEKKQMLFIEVKRLYLEYKKKNEEKHVVELCVLR